MLRDGMHQTAVHAGVAPYRPNSLDGGCPFVAGRRTRAAYVEVAGSRSEGVKAAHGAGVVRRPLQPGPAVLTAA